MKASEPSFRSAKLSYTKNFATSFNLEFLRIQNTIYSYLVLYSPKSTCKKEETSIFVSIDNVEYEKKGKGNKRITLDQETTELLINALKNNKKITIECHGDEIVLEPSNFSQSFEYFLHDGSTTEKIMDYFF
ncbi:MAG: hypothetical protein WCP39_07565 [Chlamydiota bacterium]